MRAVAAEAQVLGLQAQAAPLQAEVRLGMDAVVEEDGQRVVGEVVGETEIQEDDLRGEREAFPLELEELLVRAVAGHAEIDDVEAGLERPELRGQGGLVVDLEPEGHGIAERHDARGPRPPG